MNEFFSLNKSKTIFLFKFCSLIFSFLYVALILVIYATGKEIPTLKEVLKYWLLFGVVSPLFIFMLAFLAWIYNRIKRQKLFSSNPLNKLETIGFRDALKNEHTKWYFTEKIKAGLISNFWIEFDLNETSTKELSFVTYIEFEKFDSQKYHRLKRKNMIINVVDASKNYTQKELMSLSINQLENDLEEFVRILKIEGFKPLQRIVAEN